MTVLLNLIQISKLSQVLFYITALAIMQDFRGNEKKQLKMTARWPFWILFLRNLSLSYPCIYFVLYSWSSHFALFLSYINITKLLKFKKAA